MPPSFSASRRAALSMLALAATLPTGAAAQAPVPTTTAPEVAGAPLAGGASIVAPNGATDAAATARLVRIVRRDLSLSPKSKVEFDVRALEHPVRAELRVGSTGRKVASAVIAAGAVSTLNGGALRGEKLRLLVSRTDGGPHANDLEVGVVRRLQKLRATVASWYGPGLYGNRTACGQTLTRGLRGVAHKTLPCGTSLTVKYRGRSTKATVVDRGPFHGGREFDLTYATAQAIGFSSVGRVYVSG